MTKQNVASLEKIVVKAVKEGNLKKANAAVAKIDKIEENKFKFKLVQEVTLSEKQFQDWVDYDEEERSYHDAEDEDSWTPLSEKASSQDLMDYLTRIGGEDAIQGFQDTDVMFYGDTSTTLNKTLEIRKGPRGKIIRAEG